MAKLITLTQGQVAKVCDCHAHLVEGKKWCAHWNPRAQSFYAMRSSSTLERLGGAPSMTPMHVVINNTPKGMKTDHINGDTLDNQCSNLRTATIGENNLNSPRRATNKSGFKGVSWHKLAQRYRATISVNGKWKYLGYFDTPEAAARAYDEAARKLHGAFARTNFQQE